MSDMFPQSHTSMDTFKTCPRQYEAKYVTHEVEFEETDATRWGNLVHKSLEDYMTDGTPVPSNVPYKKFADWMLARPGELIIEGKFAIHKDITATDYRDKTAWIRAKIDVLIIRPCGTIAEVFDWKTGKFKQDANQLLLYAIMVMAKYPSVKEVRCGNVWLSTGTLPSPISYFRMNLESLVAVFRDRHAMIAAAYDRGVFVPQTSGLCHGWCPVRRCEHWKPKRKK